jgi:predicted DCC family thiol-disulfide oxidoreductase YuxK
MSAEHQTAHESVLLVYDGNCGFCRRSIAAVRRRDRSAQFIYLPRQTPGIEERYPQLGIGDFEKGMRLIEPDGTMHIGADAIYQIASRLPYFRGFSWLYHLPVVRCLTRRLYAWIAANRLKLSQYCKNDSACEFATAAQNMHIKDPVRGFWNYPSKIFISIFIVLVIGSHALPVLQELHGHRQTFWPIMAWGMYRYAHDATRPIEVSIRRLIGVTLQGKEFEITSDDSGLFYFGFVRLYLGPIVNGDASAAQGLASRVNVGRDDPVIAMRLEGDTYTLTQDGVVKKPNAILYFRITSQDA